MAFWSEARKLQLIFHLTVPFLCYFTHRTIARRFFPEIKAELKWVLVVLYGYIMLNYLLVWLTKAGPVRVRGVPNCEELGIKHPEHVKQLSEQCEKCKSAWRPPRARHCDACGVCVFRRDHHSEWFNNCIGIRNQKALVLLSVACALLALIVLSINITAFFIWTQQLRKPLLEGGVRITFTKFIVITQIVLGFGLLLFAGNYLLGQFFSIRDNQTQCEQEDGDVVGRPADFETNFVQVFGKWGWWLPLPASVDVNYLELTYRRAVVAKTGLYLEDLFHKSSAQHFNDFQRYNLM